MSLASNAEPQMRAVPRRRRCDAQRRRPRSRCATSASIAAIRCIARVRARIPQARRPAAPRRRSARAVRKLWHDLGVPLVAIAVFLFVWSRLSAGIQTSLGQIPGPDGGAGSRRKALWADHLAEREKARGVLRAPGEAQRRAAGRRSRRATIVDAQVHRQADVHRPDLHQPEDGVRRIPAGDAASRCRSASCAALSKTVNAALNPLIQLFKPVSPLAWLPIVTMLVSARVRRPTIPMFEKSFINSAITVTLCSLWPTVINTALGVGSIDRDLMNVARVLQPRLVTQAVQARAAVVAAADLHGHAPVAGRGLDGADRRGNAGAEPGPRKIRLGRIPERQLRIARAASWWRCSPSASSASCSTA